MTGAAKSVVAGTCVLLLITGCGGGGSSTANTDPKAETPTPTAVATPTAQPTPTHAEFIRRFDKTCTEPTAYKGMSQQFEDKFEAGEYEAAADLSARLTRGATVVQERRRKLTVPTQDAADFQTYVDVQDHYLALLRRLTLTLRDGDVTEIVRVAEALQRARGERLDAATDLGSTNCGK